MLILKWKLNPHYEKHPFIAGETPHQTFTLEREKYETYPCSSKSLGVKEALARLLVKSCTTSVSGLCKPEIVAEVL
jgi:hypothetical protein